MSRLRFVVVGVGHLGKEHARILSTFADVELVGVVDTRFDQAQAIAARCRTIAYTDHRPLVDRVDAAVVAVPTRFHAAVARPFLERGVGVLIEKPLASSVPEASDLVALARQHNTFIQVGHIERFNPVVLDLLCRPLRPRFVRAERLGGFTGRSLDIGVVLDLMIHDIDLLLEIVGSPIREVDAQGISVLGGQEDLAHARLVFANGCIAELTASRLSRTPSRKMELFGAEGYAALDFQAKKVTLVQPGPMLGRLRRSTAVDGLLPSVAIKDRLWRDLLQVRELDLNHGDQLTRELRDFVHCVRTGATPTVTGQRGLEAVRVATQVLEAMARHSWTGGTEGPMGPNNVPEPQGVLFDDADSRSRAA